MQNEEFEQAILEISQRLMVGPDSHRIAFLRLVSALETNRIIVSYMDREREDLNLYIKYTMFDLEATRRERDELRAMLEDRE